MKRKVIEIIDGDTFRVDKKINGIDIVRLQYPDAPELGERYYKEAKEKLGELIYKKTVEIRAISIDKYRRIIGEVTYREFKIQKVMEKYLGK